MKILLKLIVLLVFASNIIACATTGVDKKSVNLTRAAEVNAQLGNGYLAQGKLESSKSKFEKALKQNPNLAAAHAGYGLLLSRLGEIPSAEKHFKRALKLDPFDSDVINNYGVFLCGQNRIEQAEQQFIKALRDPLYKTPEFAYTNAGRCSLKANQDEKAEAYFGKALQSNPQFPGALYQMAVLSEKRGNYRLANSYMERYAENGIHNPESLWLAIQLARINGDKDAQASYELLLKNKFADSEQAALLRSKQKIGN